MCIDLASLLPVAKIICMFFTLLSSGCFSAGRALADRIAVVLVCCPHYQTLMELTAKLGAKQTVIPNGRSIVAAGAWQPGKNELATMR